MSTITIRGIDETTARILKERAKKEGISVNAVLLKTLRESLGLQKKRRNIIHNDLDHLAGTWSEKDFAEFQKRIADFEILDEKMWK
ncbi:MAG: antitoxin [Nitrospirae bacterium]|nr:antitoxin [Nitrospirota bacterium]